MTHTDYTKKILRIEDNNIYFNEDCLEIRKVMIKKSTYFMVILLILLIIVFIVDV